MRAFERQPGESQRAYNAFQKYLALGPERTLAAAADEVYGRYKKGTRRQAPGKIKEWAKRFDWHDRAQGWDDLLAMTRLEAVEESERKRVEDLVERERKLDEEILSLKEQLIPKLIEMLQFPLAVEKEEREGEDGKPQIVYVKPARWSFNTVARMLEVLDKTPGRLDLTTDVEPVRFTLWLGEHEPHAEEREEG